MTRMKTARGSVICFTLCTTVLVVLSHATTVAGAEAARKSIPELKEFLEGGVSKFSSKDHPKAKGANFSINFPRSWLVQESDRPNIVQKFSSQNGRGFESANITTKRFSVSIPERERSRLLSSAERLRDLLPKEATVLSTKPTKIEGQPAGLVEYSINAGRAGLSFEMRALSLAFFQEQTLVVLSFFVAVPGGDSAARFEDFKPLFQAVMNSIVFN